MTTSTTTTPTDAIRARVQQARGRAAGMDDATVRAMLSTVHTPVSSLPGAASAQQALMRQFATGVRDGVVEALDQVLQLLDQYPMEWWGSDCLDCNGNTTHESMRCDTCNSTNTVPLFRLVQP